MEKSLVWVSVSRKMTFRFFYTVEFSCKKMTFHIVKNDFSWRDFNYITWLVLFNIAAHNWLDNKILFWMESCSTESLFLHR